MKMHLSTISAPEDVKSLGISQLEELAEEVRQKIIDVCLTNKTGHLAPSLGATDIIVALLKVFDLEKDKLLFDISHMAYSFKILTEKSRPAAFDTLRQLGGISGFSTRGESKYDIFTEGHAGKSIAEALGFAIGRDYLKRDFHVVVVIGDGGLTSGMALESLNMLGYRKHKKVIVLLNENGMSISSNVGALSVHFARARLNPVYVDIKTAARSLLADVPFGEEIKERIERGKDKFKSIVPGMDGTDGTRDFFEYLGFEYIGVLDGHSIADMVEVFKLAKDYDYKPVVIHVKTQKGKGYPPAEKDPTRFHGI